MNDDLQIRDVAVLLSVGKQNMISVNGKMKMKLDNKDFDFEGMLAHICSRFPSKNIVDHCGFRFSELSTWCFYDKRFTFYGYGPNKP